jgi:hypothetical protein
MCTTRNTTLALAGAQLQLPFAGSFSHRFRLSCSFSHRFRLGSNAHRFRLGSNAHHFWLAILSRNMLMLTIHGSVILKLFLLN